MEPIEINCPDPRFDPSRPVTVNGFSYVPAAAPWQPIGTAPRDFTHIIVAVTGGRHGPTVCEAYWHPGDSRWDADWWLGATSPADYTAAPISDIMHGRVSHWMPLPEAPEMRIVE